jgi:hypothetical protein
MVDHGIEHEDDMSVGVIRAVRARLQGQDPLAAMRGGQDGVA